MGGLETHMLNLGRGLMAAGFQIIIACDGESQVKEFSFERYTGAGFICRKVNFPGPALAASSVPKALASVWQVNSLVDAFNPSLIHVHYRMTSSYAQAMQVVHGVPFISTIHLTNIPSSALYRFVSFWGQRVIAPSIEARDYVVNTFGVKPDRVRLVPHGTDETYFRPPSEVEKNEARMKFGLTPHDKVIAMIARMESTKGQDVLLDSLAHLRAKGVQPKALLAGVSISGSVEWRDRMMRYAKDLGLEEQVQFLGHAQTRDVLWASDSCVLPSHQEGFAIAIIEAMLCGVVPIRTPAAGATEQIDDGVNGFITPFNDSKGLSDRLDALLNDTERRTTMSAATLEKAREKFSAKAMVDKTLAVYNEVLPVG
jgi:glycosyltransferase involved in cell wall biosynthesis